MKTRFVLALLVAAPAFGQLQVSFQPQPDAVVKKITGGVPSLKNIKLYQATICNSGSETRSVNAGSIYIAAQKSKIATVGPAAATFIFTRVPQLHPLAIALDVAQYGSYVVGILGSADTIALSSNVRAVLPLLGPGLKAASDKLTGIQPDFSTLAKAILDGQMALPPSVCEDRLLFATAGPADATFAEVDAAAVPQPGQK